MNQFIIIEYSDGWMILQYKDGVQDKYWSCAEDSWDNVWNYMEAQEKETIHFKLPSYNMYLELESELGIDIFDLSKKDIENLKKRLIKYMN